MLDLMGTPLLPSLWNLSRNQFPRVPMMLMFDFFR